MNKIVPILMVTIWLGSCTTRDLIPDSVRVSDLERARAKAHRDKGTHLLVNEGKVADAGEEFRLALQLDPIDPFSRQWAAWISGLEGNYEEAFEHLLWLIQNRHPSAEPAVWMAYRLFSRRDQAERLERVLREVAGREGTPPLIRARALHFLGHTLRYQGKEAQASKAFRELGLLSDWMLVGPFNNDQNAGFDTSYPPEQGISDYKQTYPGKLREVGFRKVEYFDFDGRVNLAALLDPSRWTCAYLVTFVQSPDDREVAFRIGAYRGVKLWLNNRLLLSDDEAHLGALDQYVVGGKLERGWNQVLVKVCQRTGDWQLRLRITDLEGKPATALVTTTRIHPFPDRSADTSPLPQPQSWGKLLADTKEDESGLYRFHRAVWNRRLGFTRRAVEEALELVTAHPSCPLYWMELARAHFGASHEGSALKALSAAEKIQPGLVDAVLERAQYESRNGRYDRAMRLLEKLPEQTRKLPSIQALWISLLYNRGFFYDALRKAREFLSDQPDRASTWRSIASLHSAMSQQEKEREAYQKAMQLQANHSGTYNGLIAIALRKNRIGRAIDLVRKKIKMFPGLITSALKEAEIHLAQGRYDRALAVCDRIAKVAPDYWYLHKLQGDVHYRRGDRNRALEQYHQAIELHPDNPALREYLDFLEKKIDVAFETYAISETEVEQIIAEKPERKAFPEAEAVFLLDDHVSHVFQDGSSKHLVHQIYLVTTEKAQRRFNHFRVPASSSFRLEVAETIQPDGTRQEATSIRRGVIHFPSLEPGSVLHVAYRYESSSLSWMQDHFAMSYNFQGNDPSLRARWVLVMPEDKELKILKTGALIEEKTEAMGKEKVFIWTVNNAPMLHQESLRPPARNIRSSVYVSTVPSWDELAKWQNSLISDQFDIDEDIRVKTRELVRDAATPMDKLKAIYRFVAKEIRYLNNDAGIFGKKPNKAVNIFENRFGDCKDKATLMIAMLKEIGIDAAYAGVRTFDRGPVFWEVPHAQTNHIITYIPAQAGIEKPLFVDGTSQYGDLRYLPDRDQGIKALVLDGTTYQILETPLLPADTSTLRCQMSARIAGDSLTIEADETWTGWFASWFRSRLNVEGKRREELIKEMNYRFPGAQLNRDEYRGLDTLDWEAGVRFELEVPGLVRKEGSTLRVNLLWPSNMVRRTSRTPERHYDIFMVYRTNFSLANRLVVPDNYKVRTLPRRLSIDNEWISFKQDCTLDLSTVTCTRELLVKQRVIPLEHYQSYRNMCRSIDQAEAQDIVLEPLL